MVEGMKKPKLPVVKKVSLSYDISKMGLVGDRVMDAARGMAMAISSQVDLNRLCQEPDYGKWLCDNVMAPVIERYAKQERTVIQAYFEIPPENTPYLTPDDQVIGVLLTDLTKKGDFQRNILIQTRDFHPGNHYMTWFYEPVRKKKGVWSEVYFDLYVRIDIISYNLPVFVKGHLLGVVGLDLDYNDFHQKVSERLIRDIENNVQLLKKEHEALGQSSLLAGQYISLDTLEIINPENIFDGFIMHSREMEQVMNLSLKAAISPANVLILGETGVGKDYIANFIHKKSRYRGGPFVNVNCSAIPESLLESEFFGCEKGAFTGAKNEGKAGYFEAAKGGTIFLNEIGELPLHLQAKFLNVLQQKQVTRVGGTVPRRVDFRLISATNRNLYELMQKGMFREDLYYRLNVIPIHIPPLRDRKNDVLSLLTFFLHKHADAYGVTKRFSTRVLDRLMNYTWPGNIRELENVVERLVVTTEDEEIREDGLPGEFYANEEFIHDFNIKQGITLRDMITAYEAAIIRRKYRELGSSYKVARELGISQTQANRKIREYVLNRRGEDMS